MSSGAVLQLAARGQQDLFIMGNPQITYFKSVFKRHTPFAMETTENFFDGIHKTGQKLQCKLERVGDMVHQIYLRFKLPSLQLIQGEDNLYTSWVNSIGYVLINYIEIQIGNKVIDRQYGQWMDIWSELTTPDDKRDALYNMIGKSNFFTNSTQNGPLDLYVPLQFWFCKNIGDALPLVAIQHQDIRINVQLKSFNLLYTSNDFSQAEQVLPSMIEFDQISLLVNYIFLDTDERRYFAQSNHFYLIEQLQMSKQSLDINEEINIIELPFNHPVKELIWVFQGQKVKNLRQWTNYSGDPITLLGSEPKPPIIDAIIRFEGVERFEIREERYFRVVLPWKYHTAVPTDNFIYIYSFSENPEKTQPSGSANFSRLDRATLHVRTNNQKDEFDCTVYALNYNIFRIVGGITGIMFAN